MFQENTGGVIYIQFPIVIFQYNKYMGGVYLADMQLVHCNAMVVGMN